MEILSLFSFEPVELVSDDPSLSLSFNSLSYSVSVFFTPLLFSNPLVKDYLLFGESVNGIAPSPYTINELSQDILRPV